MNIYDTANKLAKEIKESKEYKEYKKLKSHIEENQNKKESEPKIKSENQKNKKENEPQKMSQEKKKLTPLALFKYPSVRYTFILFCLLWFFSTALYNGLTIGLKSLPGNIYLNSLLLFLYFSTIFDSSLFGT